MGQGVAAGGWGVFWGAVYTDVFTLWKFVKVYSFDMCTFLSVILQKKLNLKKWNILHPENLSVLWSVKTDPTKSWDDKGVMVSEHLNAKQFRDRKRWRL